MTLACLYLYVSVMFPPVGKLPHPPFERYTVIECTRDSNMSEDLYGDSGYSECEVDARQTIKKLQFAGVLPGSSEVIHVIYKCDNET